MLRPAAAEHTIVVGVDVGGTNTDAVVLKGTTILGANKSFTTPDVTSGIVNAAEEAIRAASVSPADISCVMIGTTHFVNAVVQCRELAPTACLRLCGPVSQGIPPCASWPTNLRDSVLKFSAFLPGGFEYDNSEIMEIDEAAVRAACAEIKELKISNVAISCIFSPVNASHEVRVAAIVAEELGVGATITLSSQIAAIGLVERENATVLNASVRPLAARTVRGFQAALAALGLTCPLMLTQNDGTLMRCDDAARFPIRTFASGPTNSMRGAALLCGGGGSGAVSDAVVVDIGGTTSEVGVLVGGLARAAPLGACVGGVSINYRMPDVLSLGLGGGSMVALPPGEEGEAKGGAVGSSGGGGLTVGPVSVGYALNTESVVFGGSTVTATDLAVASGASLVSPHDGEEGPAEAENAAVAATTGAAALPVVGRVPGVDAATVRARLAAAGVTASVAAAGLRRMVWMVEDAVDRMKTTSEPVPVLLVGGGSFLLRDELQRRQQLLQQGGDVGGGGGGEVMRGASSVTIPPHFGVANAVGAALAQVPGVIDEVLPLLEGQSREQRLAAAQQRAVALAVSSGAIADTVSVMECDEIPLAYLPGGIARIRVKAVGDLDLNQLQIAAAAAAVVAVLPPPAATATTAAEVKDESDGDETLAAATAAAAVAAAPAPAPSTLLVPPPPAAAATAFPAQPGDWLLTERDIDAIALGAAVMGTGGGGSPVIGAIRAKMLLRHGYVMRVIAAERLLQQPHSAPAATPGDAAASATPAAVEAVVASGAFMGAPTVFSERLEGLSEVLDALRAVEAADGVTADAIIPAEIGGMNSIEPLITAACAGLPVVDGDGMGRAYPRLEMVTYFYLDEDTPLGDAVKGDPRRLGTAAIADAHGECVLCRDVACPRDLEATLRTECVARGCCVGLVLPLMPAAKLRALMVPHTLSQAWRLGNAVLAARQRKADPVATITSELGGVLLFTGKVTSVIRDTEAGFAKGRFVVTRNAVHATAAGDSGEATGASADSAGASSAATSLTVEFQNENLAAFDAHGTMVACVPDLISVVDSETGRPFVTEEMTFGLRVCVLALPCNPRLTCERARAVVGPAAFGYEDKGYQGIGQYQPVEPVPTCAKHEEESDAQE